MWRTDRQRIPHRMDNREQGERGTASCIDRQWIEQRMDKWTKDRTEDRWKIENRAEDRQKNT